MVCVVFKESLNVICQPDNNMVVEKDYKRIFFILFNVFIHKKLTEDYTKNHNYCFHMTNNCMLDG